MTVAETMWLIVLAYAVVQVSFPGRIHGQPDTVALPLLFMVPILLGHFR